MRTSWIRLLMAGFVLYPPWRRNGTDARSAAGSNRSSQALLKSEELDQLLAPIALYSDTLLAEVLMAVDLSARSGAGGTLGAYQQGSDRRQVEDGPGANRAGTQASSRSLPCRPC